MADLRDAIDDAVAVLLAEIRAGDGLSMTAAAREFPAHRGTGTLNPSTLHRWGLKGARGADGQLVRLAMIRIGGRWLTTRGAVARFAAALTSASAVVVASPRSPAARTHASDRAEAELKRMGA